MAENILHFGAVRLRLNGTGNLDMQWIGLDDTKTSDLLALTMSESPGYEPTRLCNFLAQRARLKISTNKINEHFKINRIVVFIKPKATSLPM